MDTKPTPPPFYLILNGDGPGRWMRVDQLADREAAVNRVKQLRRDGHNAHIMAAIHYEPEALLVERELPELPELPPV